MNSGLSIRFENERLKGKKERNIEIAKNLLKKGMSVGDIADVTDLTLKEIEKIQTELAASH